MASIDPKKAKYLRTLTFEGEWPTAICFIGNDQVAVGNRNGELYIWDLNSETLAEVDEKDKEKPWVKKRDKNAAPDALPIVKLEGHTNAVNRLLCTKDGKTLISASNDTTIRFWNPAAAPTGKVEVRMDWRQRYNYDNHYSRKGKPDKAVDKPGVVIPSLNKSEVLKGHAHWVQALELSRDESRMISGDDGANVVVWEMPSRKELTRWKGYHTNAITTASLTSDGKTAFVGEYCASRSSFDRPPAQAKIVKADNGELLIDLLVVQFPKVKERDGSYGYATTWGKFVANGFFDSDFSPDGKLLAVSQSGETGTGKIHLIDTSTGKIVRSLAGHKGGATQCRFTADGSHVISGGRDTVLRVWETSSGKDLGTLATSRGGQFKDWIYGFAISPDNKKIAATDIAGLVHVWELTTA